MSHDTWSNIELQVEIAVLYEKGIRLCVYQLSDKP